MSSMSSPGPPPEIDLDQLVHRLSGSGEARCLVGIAGAPGSGKSTIARLLEERLNGHSAGSAAILPMDGFHYDDGLLTSLGRLARKGAPDTFDVDGFRHMLLRLREASGEHVAVPVFDRDLEISRAGARLIPRHVRVVIVEGNYLLLTEEPWAGLRPLFHLTVAIEASGETLRQRLTQRWQHYDLPAGDVRRRVEDNDLPNGRLVIARSATADFRLLSERLVLPGTSSSGEDS